MNTKELLPCLYSVVMSDTRYIRIDHVPSRLPPLYLFILSLCLPASDANVSRFCRGILISNRLGSSMHSYLNFLNSEK